MKKKKTFISYKYEDKKYKDKIEMWSKVGKLGKDIQTVSETKDVRQNGDKAVKKYLNEKIINAEKFVVLVGDDTHNSQGVDYELRNARSANKEIIPIRIPGTTGGVPEILKKEKIVNFDPNSIKKALNDDE